MPVHRGAKPLGRRSALGHVGVELRVYLQDTLRGRCPWISRRFLTIESFAVLLSSHIPPGRLLERSPQREILNS